MNGEEGSLSVECNGDANAINIVETMKFKIAAISIHDDAENEEFYEFYEELEAILNVAEEAKEIKIDVLVKANIHVDVTDISVRNINVEFYPQGRSSYEKMLQHSTEQGIAEGKFRTVTTATEFHKARRIQDLEKETEEDK